jgi:hypothetical protein
VVKDLAERFDVISGVSDHTLGATVPVVATCFGAKIIEKHFILDRSIGGPDASFSMNEEEFKAMVKAVREAESAIGIVDYTLTEKLAKGKEFSRSLYVVEDIKAGDLVTEKNVKSIRPGFGLHPKYYKKIFSIEFLMSVLLVVWMADIAAYFSGKAFGKHKLAPDISPGKTWEGVGGAVAGVFLLSYVWLTAADYFSWQSSSIFDRLYEHGSVVLVSGLLFLVMMSVAGDLIESLVKRSAGAKDSSQLLPGHGGILDRIDALLPTLPLAVMLALI